MIRPPAIKNKKKIKEITEFLHVYKEKITMCFSSSLHFLYLSISIFHISVEDLEHSSGNIKHKKLCW